jgi:micrococcal nuclease
MRIFVFILACLGILFANRALASTTSFKNVEYVANYDGDTFTVNIKGLPPIFGTRLPIRIKGIDTAELNGNAPCEKEMAKLAKTYVRDLLTKATKIDLENIQRGSFFRVVADVRLSMSGNKIIMLGDNLVAQGYAIPYSTKPKINWCTQKGKIRR